MWLVDMLLNRTRWTQNRVPLNDRRTVEFDPLAFVLSDDPINLRTFVTLVGTLLSPTLNNPTITGTLTQGAALTLTLAGTTTGPSTVAMTPTIALADNSGGTLDLRLAGWAPGFGLCSASVQFVIQVASGVFNPIPVAALTAITAQNTGLPFAQAIDPTWATGAITVTVGGPEATIVSAASHGGGTSTLLTIETSQGQVVDPSLSSQSVTISGGTGINGAHVATWISATTFSIPVAWTGMTSVGDVVLTTPPVIPWQAWALAVVSPKP